MIVVLMLGRARRRSLSAAVLAVGLISAVSVASVAEAATSTTTRGKPSTDDEGVALTQEEKAAIPAPPTKPVAEPGSHDPDATVYSLYLAGSGSYDEPALALTLGFRMRMSRHWTLGVDGEWNPWLALNTTGLRAGAINLSAVAMFRLPMAYEDFNLRSTVNLGGSYLLTDLYGAPAGSMGIYFGVAPLGIEWKLSHSFYLVINPLSIAMPVPQLSGVPLVYPQYRITVGLEYAL